MCHAIGTDKDVNNYTIDISMLTYVNEPLFHFDFDCCLPIFLSLGFFFCKQEYLHDADKVARFFVSVSTVNTILFLDFLESPLFFLFFFFFGGGGGGEGGRGRGRGRHIVWFTCLCLH